MHKKIKHYFDNIIFKINQNIFYNESEKFIEYFKNIPFEYKIGFIREFAKSISSKKIFELLKGNNFQTPINSKYFNEINNSVSTTEDTIYITDINRADRFTSCNIYDSIREFKQNPNHKGFYLQEFDIAFIQNGSHSINLAYMFGRVNLKTNQYFQHIKMNDTFLNLDINPTNNDFCQYSLSRNQDTILLWIAIQEYLRKSTT